MDAFEEGEEEEAGTSSLAMVNSDPVRPSWAPFREPHCDWLTLLQFFDPLPRRGNKSESGWGIITTASSFASMQDEKRGMGWPDEAPVSVSQPPSDTQGSLDRHVDAQTKLDVLILPPQSSRSPKAFGFATPSISCNSFATLLLSCTIGPCTPYPSLPTSTLPMLSEPCANGPTVVVEDCIASGRIWDCYSARLYHPVSPERRYIRFTAVVVKLSSASQAYRRPQFHPSIAWDDLSASSDREDSLYQGPLRSLSHLDGEARVVTRYLGLYEGSFHPSGTGRRPFTRCPVRIMIMENMGSERSSGQLRL